MYHAHQNRGQGAKGPERRVVVEKNKNMVREALTSTKRE